jgi:hypothetical protein
MKNLETIRIISDRKEMASAQERLDNLSYLVASIVMAFVLFCVVVTS